jgi:hypothetical protein
MCSGLSARRQIVDTKQNGGGSMRDPWLTAVLISVLAGFLFCGSAPGAVVLNELVADPASDWSPSDGNDEYGALEDEWVEILNTGPDPVDVTGWRLHDAVSDSSWRFGFGGVLEVGEYLVVYGNEAYDWEDANGYPRNGLSLNNSGDTVTLVASDLVTVMDEVSYEGFHVLDDRAYGRMPDGTSEWRVFDGLNPLSPPDTGFMPTPGEPCAGSPIEVAAWGRIKALYRRE